MKKKSIKNPKKFKLVEIKWIDSASPANGSWVVITGEQLKEDYIAICYSSGYLIGETKKEYKVCNSYHEINETDINAIGYIAIPKVAIISMKSL